MTNPYNTMDGSRKLGSESADNYFNLGVAYCGTGKLDEALSAYQNPIRIEPDYSEAYGRLGGFYEK